MCDEQATIAGAGIGVNFSRAERREGLDNQIVIFTRTENKRCAGFGINFRRKALFHWG